MNMNSLWLTWETMEGGGTVINNSALKIAIENIILSFPPPKPIPGFN